MFGSLPLRHAAYLVVLRVNGFHHYGAIVLGRRSIAKMETKGLLDPTWE